MKQQDLTDGEYLEWRIKILAVVSEYKGEVAVQPERARQLLASLVSRLSELYFEPGLVLVIDEEGYETYLSRLHGGPIPWIWKDLSFLADELMSVAKELLSAQLDRYTSKAMKRLVKLQTDPSKARGQLVDPLLAEKGWSKLDWAQDSKVDYKTVTGYLSGKRKPYVSTRKKLAKSLNLSVGELPD